VSPAQGSSGAGTCPVGSSTLLLVQDSSGGAACHRLGAALASRRRSALGAPCVTGSGQLQASTCSVGSSTRLPAQDSSGVSRVPVASGRRKNVRLTSSETELRMIFLAPAARRRAALGAPCVPAAPGRMKTIKPMQKT
jgi:hypothetical protein